MLISGCSAPKPAALNQTQVSAVTDSILKALDARDYQQFHQDFSDQMNSAFTQAQFDHLHDLLQGASGTYESLGSPSLSNNQGYAVYRFPAKYTKETVYVTVTFLIGGTKVEGLFMDSLNLRKSAQ
jgi:hypothetical protein